MNLKREPVAIANGLLALLVAALGLLSAFDVWTPNAAQLTALSTAYIALAAFVIYLLRGVVYTAASVQHISDAVELVRTAPDEQLAGEADEALAGLLPPPKQ